VRNSLQQKGFFEMNFFCWGETVVVGLTAKGKSSFLAGMNNFNYKLKGGNHVKIRAQND